MKDKLIWVNNLCKSYSSNKNMILNKINLDIYKGDFTVIMGPSGAGKSTLLYVLSGIDSLSSGKIFYKGKEISDYKEKDMAYLRSNEFGFIFQQNYLVSNLTLFENIAVAGYIGMKDGEREVQKRALNLLKQMKLDNLKDRLPYEVSGGEAQRVSIARSIISKPEIIFADEPTGALNKNNTNIVLDILSEINKDKKSILMVTHDIRSASRANRILYMEDGNIIGEISLPPYNHEEAKEREKKINDWLLDMKW